MSIGEMTSPTENVLICDNIEKIDCAVGEQVRLLVFLAYLVKSVYNCCSHAIIGSKFSKICDDFQLCIRDYSICYDICGRLSHELAQSLLS